MPFRKDEDVFDSVERVDRGLLCVVLCLMASRYAALSVEVVCV